MPYQTFPNEPGDSKSDEKLVQLRFPDSMVDKSFLDLGCNEGYFCLEAKKRGAANVVGIDCSEKFINKAKDRANKQQLKIDYICDTWHNFPEGKFDYILLSSALHYEEYPTILINKIYDHLKDNGTFILECGCMLEVLNPSSAFVKRNIDWRFFPKIDILINDWLKHFAVRCLGQSVQQEGDSVTRLIFHCNKWIPTIIFVMGEGLTGKSSLCSHLTADENIIHTDYLFVSTFIHKFSTIFNETCGDIGKIFNSLQHNTSALKELSIILLQAISLNCNKQIIYIEGYGLRFLLPFVLPELEKKKFYFWKMKRI